MTSPPPRRSGGPYERVRRWAGETPNATMALSMITTGVLLIALAIVIALFAL